MYFYFVWVLFNIFFYCEKFILMLYDIYPILFYFGVLKFFLININICIYEKK